MSSTIDSADDRIPRIRVAWFFALALTGVVVDLWTKHLVFRHPEMYPGSEWWLWEGHVGIQKTLNEGALAGLGQGKVGVFVAIAIVSAVAIPVWLFRFRAAHDRGLCVALGCILGGILGNLYDRLGLPGLVWDRFHPARQGEAVYAVRDWMLVQWNSQWVWPNFNIADALLVVGACLLAIQAFFPTSADGPSRPARG